MLTTSDAARALVAARPTIEVACAICGEVTRKRARKRVDGEPLQPMASYCGPNHRAKAAYQRRLAARRPNLADSPATTKQPTPR